VVTYNGGLIGAFYFAHCDGHTRNSQDVWKFSVPYCQSVPCNCGNTQLHGHGVGMCQEGAMAMAKQGALAEEILAHYYIGTSVTRTGA
jgi:peptidoglycan hydrolase-like amidase